jgi:hypothetical protein
MKIKLIRAKKMVSKRESNEGMKARKLRQPIHNL